MKMIFFPSRGPASAAASVGCVSMVVSSAVSVAVDSVVAAFSAPQPHNGSIKIISTHAMNRFKFYHLGNTLATYRVFVNTVTGFGAGRGYL